MADFKKLITNKEQLIAAMKMVAEKYGFVFIGFDMTKQEGRKKTAIFEKEGVQIPLEINTEIDL